MIVLTCHLADSDTSSGCAADVSHHLIITVVRLAPFQCIALLSANNLQRGLTSASSVASAILRLSDDRSFFIVASQKV